MKEATDHSRPARGGARNTGMTLSSNTSGLGGIRFGVESGVLRVYVCWRRPTGGYGNTSYSIRSNGRRLALQRAIDKRTEAGLPAPAMEVAMLALDDYEEAQCPPT